MLPLHLRVIFKKIDEAIDKTETAANDRAESTKKQQKEIAVSIQSLADALKTDKAEQGESEKRKNRRENWTIGSLIATAAFTLALTVVAGLQWCALRSTDEKIGEQAKALIESERAFLVIPNISFKYIEPATSDDGFDLAIAVKNVGKHTAIVSRLDIKPAFFVKIKTLADDPDYTGSRVDKVVPPVVPTDQVVVSLHMGGVRSANPEAGPVLPQTERVAGVTSGDIPFRVVPSLGW
jgi:hypothetical protein